MADFQQWVQGGEMSVLEGRRILHRQDGPPGGLAVTLIHGYPTSSHDWELILPALVAAGCRVTTFDLLGFGGSEKPQGHRYSLIEQATIAEALWRQLGISSTALVAHDYGVSVAQELLARDAPRFTRVAFLNGGLYPDLHRPIPVQRLLHSPAGALLGPLSTERLYRRALSEILGRPVSDHVMHQMWLATSSGGGRWVQHGLLRYIDERTQYAKRWIDALESFPRPQAFIWGPADPISGAHVLARLRERRPDATFVELSGPPPVGHYPQPEDPATVGAALGAFLSA